MSSEKYTNKNYIYNYIINSYVISVKKEVNKLSDTRLQRNDNAGRTIICGGTTYDTGSSLLLSGKDNNNGGFILKASNGSTTKELIGSHTGSLTWNGDEVVTNVNLFTNLPPKVGFLDDIKVQLYGAFNMSYCTNHSGWYIFNDAEGREVAFARSAASSISNTQKVFRGYRMKHSDSFIFDNDPMVCGFFKSEVDSGTDVYVNDIYGLTDDYIIVHVVGGSLNDKTILAFTQTSGTPTNWTNNTGYLYITSDISAYGNGIIRVVDSSNRIWYITHTISVSGGATTIESNWQGSEYKVQNVTLVMYIYQVTENKSSHTVNIVSSRTESIVIGGPEIWGTQLYNNKYKQYLYTSVRNSPRMAYLKEFNKLYITYTMYYRYYYLDTDQNIVVSGGDYGNSHSLVYNFTPDDCNTSGYFSNKSNMWASPDRFTSQSYMTSCAEYSTNSSTALTYSELTKTLYYAKCDWDGYYNRIITLPITDDVITSMKDARNLLYIQGYGEAASMPDTSPWGKFTYSANIIGSAVILYSGSQKFSGGRLSYIQPTLLKDSSGNIISNSYLVSQTGKWAVINWLYGEPSNPQMTCVRNTSDTSTYGGATWYRVYRTDNSDGTSTFTAQVISGAFNSSTDKVLTLADGTTVTDLPRLQNTTYTAKFTSSAVTTSDQFFYSYSDEHTSLGRCFIAIRYGLAEVTKNSDSTYSSDNKIFGIIYKVNMSGGVTTYNLKDFTAYSRSGSSWVDWDYNTFCLTSAINLGKTTSTYWTGPRSNMFIDSDGMLCYRVWNYRAVGIPSYSPMWFKVDLLNKKLYYYGTGDYWYVSYHSIGYQNEWGYFLSACNGAAYIVSTKDKFNNKTYTNTLDGCVAGSNGTDRIYHTFPTSPTTDCVAYLQKTALYLGGYFSYIEAQEVYLNDGDNYIYIMRDASTRELKVEVYDKKIGVEGASQFNRIMVAYIKCSNGMMVYQKNYEINNYGS